MVWYFLNGSGIQTVPILVTFFTGGWFRFDSVAPVSAWKSVVGAGLAPCKIHSVALSTLFQVLLRALVSIVVQLKWRPALDDAIAMYFPADPAPLHSFPPCLLCQQRGILFIVPVKSTGYYLYGLSPVFSGGVSVPSQYGYTGVDPYWCLKIYLTSVFWTYHTYWQLLWDEA